MLPSSGWLKAWPLHPLLLKADRLPLSLPCALCLSIYFFFQTWGTFPEGLDPLSSLLLRSWGRSGAQAEAEVQGGWGCSPFCWELFLGEELLFPEERCLPVPPGGPWHDIVSAHPIQSYLSLPFVNYMWHELSQCKQLKKSFAKSKTKGNPGEMYLVYFSSFLRCII